jgi:hypothetical protein
LTDITLVLKPVSHDRPRVFRSPSKRARRRKFGALAAFAASRLSPLSPLAVLVFIAVGVYVIAFVILSPMLG